MVEFVDLDDVRMRLAALREHLPGVRIQYAMNGYAEPDVLNVLADAAVGFDAASIRDIEQLAGHGVDLSGVTFAAAIKPVDDVAAAYEYGVRAFAAGSFDEVTKIATAAPGSAVYVAVDDGRVDAAGLALIARNRGLEPAGLSIQIDSHATGPKAWTAAIHHVAPIYRRLAAEGLELGWLNVGGGFPCQYRSTSAPSLDQIGTAIEDGRRELPDGVGLVAVSGRYPVAAAARLEATVIGRAERGLTSWLFLSAGCGNGLQAMAHHGCTQRPIVRIDGSTCSGTQKFSLAGPTGDCADVIAHDVELPSDTGLGDRLVFAERRAGYSSAVMTKSSNAST
jgi:ornithine decarboxylase